MQNSFNPEAPALNELYALADRHHITVCGFRLPECRAVSMMDAGGNCYIGLDNSTSYSAAEEKTLLAHELGHCRTGAFYNDYSPLFSRQKCERKATEWAIRHCLPREAILRACREGVLGSYALAEYFGVSEAWMQQAIDYYLQENTDEPARGNDIP